MSSASNPTARFRAPRAIFWVAFALRIACIAIGHTYRIRVIYDHFDFGFEAGRIARSLVEGHGYGNPFNGVSGPTAWLPPLFPLLLALSFKLFGVYTRAAAFFILSLDSLFSALIAPAVYEIAARCFDAQGIARRTSQRAAPVALWSAWLWAAYPAALQYAIHWIWEMSLSTFIFSWTIVFALRLRGIGEQPRDGVDQPARWTIFGALWGLVALSNASLLLCFPATVLWILWPRLRAQPRAFQIWRGPALTALVFALVMTPWWIRNELALHAFIATRDNSPAELYESTLEANDAFPWGTTMSLWPGNRDFQRYKNLGEARYMEVRKAEAFERLRTRPAKIAKWTLDRFLFFWDNTPHPLEGHPFREYGRRLSYCFLSVCGLLGLALALKRRVPGAALMGWIFLLLPLPYYLITVQARFRHPLEPLITVLAVYLFRSTEPRRKHEDHA